MTTTQLIIAFFLGSFLNTVFWGSLTVIARAYVNYRDRDLREKALKEQEAFFQLLQSRSGFNPDFDEKPESVN